MRSKYQLAGRRSKIMQLKDDGGGAVGVNRRSNRL